MTKNENCPNCESSRSEYQASYGYWECQDCGHAWGLDKDDPDYEEEEFDDCPECNGNGECDYGICHLCGGEGVVDRLPAESFYEVESIRHKNYES
nr:hypothetical protein [Nostoc sp. EkiNYC01]